MLNRRMFMGITAATACGVGSPLFAESYRSTGYQYRLPNFAKGTRLLFQGDSITDMKWGRNQSDRNHYLGHSYVYLIASRLGVDMADARLEFFNRGVSGNTVGDLERRWRKDAIDMKPDVLSILIGVNDVGRAFRGKREIDFAAWEESYRNILDQSRKANPKLKVVLLDPFVLASGRFKDQTAWSFHRTSIEKQIKIVSKLATDYDAVRVQTQRVFDEAAKAAGADQWIWDGVHPLPQGHELIARHWLDAVCKRWGTRS